MARTHYGHRFRSLEVRNARAGIETGFFFFLFFFQVGLSTGFRALILQPKFFRLADEVIIYTYMLVPVAKGNGTHDTIFNTYNFFVNIWNWDCSVIGHN